MITNERQYKITKAQLAKLQEGVDNFDLAEASERIGSKILAKAELEGITSEIETLTRQLQEYEDLKSGVVTNFVAKSLDELYLLLIQARIAQNLSQRELADLVGLKEQQIQRYESEQYASASLRRLREIAKALKLNITEIAEISFFEKTQTRDIPIDWSKFPVKEMYKRGWFKGFHGSIKDLVQEGNELVEDFITTFSKKPSFALHKKLVRSGSQIDNYALLAWECRVIDLASRATLNKKYSPDQVTKKWLDDLRKLSKLKDGPVRAKEMLNDIGISLIVEPHLPGTYLDGAAVLMNGTIPVIALTLRYDRLDNFWFVLFHELFHILKHLKKDKLEFIFDDLDMDITTDLETEADYLAGEALISSEEWDTALARYTQSSEAVLAFSSEIGISPAIVAGRIRNESKNFTILNDLIGKGEVRIHFPESTFGA